MSKIYLIIIVVLIPLNIWSLFTSKNNNEEKTKCIEVLSELKLESSNNEILMSNFASSLPFSEKIKDKIDFDNIAVEKDGRAIPLNSICNKPVLVLFRFTDAACSSCTMKQIEILQKLKNVEVICLISTKLEKSILNMNYLVNSGLSYFYIPDYKYLTHLEEEKETPFSLIIEKGKLKSTIVPIKGFSKPSEEIYNYYEKKYSSIAHNVSYQ